MKRMVVVSLVSAGLLVGVAVSAEAQETRDAWVPGIPHSRAGPATQR